MGNEQSKKNHNVQIELNHSRINFIRVINDPKKRYMQAIFAEEKKNYQQWTTSLQKAKVNSNHLLIPFEHKFQSKQFCGNSGSVQVNYDNYPYLLLDQIQNRRAKKKRFDQTELWLLLYCLLDAQKQMKMGNLSRIGDVRPQNIFFNEQGLMKVANLLSWPKQTSNYQKFLQNQPTYLAPQDMPLIQLSKIDNSQNNQSQIFSIGLTILSAANLVDYKSLYNTTARKFDIERFNSILNQWRVNDYYSDIFKATVCSIIQIDRQNRVTQQFLFPWIQKYREEILARKDFVITDPPQLVINEVQIIRKLYQNLASNYSVHNNPPIFNQSHNTDYKQVGLPLQGSRRLVEQIRHPPITVIPGSTIAESIYKPIEQPYMSKFLVQGAPISTTNPTYINRQSIPLVENQYMAESLYARNWNSQGQNVPRTNFQYSSSPERKEVEQNHENIQNIHHQQQAPQQSNQPQIHEDQPQQGDSPNKQ